MKYLLWTFLAYLVYQFIFNLVIPVYKTTRRIKKGFRDMSARMNYSEGQEHMQPGTYNSTRPGADFTTKNTARPSRNDYIEFEEVK